jgi:alkaline phosphatase
MKTNALQLTLLGLAVTLGAANAAPVVSRLNPPSALFTFGDATPPYTARFLVGQRFDLHATIQADAAKVITGASFTVDGAPVAGTVTVTPITGGAPDRFNVVLRAYFSLAPGAHTFAVTGIQDDALTATAAGNFEIVGTTVQGRKAKNIIYLIGDGMSLAHRTAARIVSKGIAQGKAIDPLAMDTLPVAAILNTPSLNSIITDSAPGAACYSTGNKSNNGQEGVFPDDTSDKWDNPRVEHMGNYLARTQGKALGIVTTADVEDATPGSFGVHAQDRGAGTGICDMYLDESVANHNLRVLLGGGRKWFIPNLGPGVGNGTGRVNTLTGTGADYTVPAELASAWGVPTGALDPARDLIADFQAAGFTYAPDATTLAAIPAATTKLLGLFHTGNMDVSLDKISERRGGAVVGTVATFPDQPLLEEMTDKALQVLSKNTAGFVLMVEGASIDKQAHNMDTERFVHDTIEFDRSVGRCIAFQQANPDTLIIVTADHECAGAAIIGATAVTNADLITRSTALGADGVAGVVNGATGAATDGQARLRSNVVNTYDSASFPVYDNTPADGYPATMDVDRKMLIGYGGNGDRYEDWLQNVQPNVNPFLRDTAGDFFIAGQASGPGVQSAVHTAADIPLSAGGRGSSLFGGTMDNTSVFFRAMQAAIGGAK